MNGTSFTREAEAAAQRYRSFLDALRGAWLRVAGSADPLMPRVRTTLVEEARQIAWSYLETERRFLADIALVTADAGTRDTFANLDLEPEDASSRVRAHVRAANEFVANEIAVQLERDVSTLVRRLQSWALDLDLIATAQGLTRKNAMVKLKIADGSPDFVFRDRAGRRMSSEKFVRSLWRQHLLWIYNEAVLFVLAEREIEEAEITHPDAKHKHNGGTIKVSPDQEPNWQTVRDDVFHPNSEALLRPKNQSPLT